MPAAELALLREPSARPCPACGARVADVDDLVVTLPASCRRPPVLVDLIAHVCCPRDECPGHGRGGIARPCCARAGDWNGYGSDGPRLFRCPAGCSCHD